MIDFKTSIVIKIAPKIAAVYQIIFDNGYFYIGATHDLYKRIAGHKAKLKTGKPYLFDIAIQAGATSCEFIIIKTFEGDIGYRKKSECFLLEKSLISKHRKDKMLINKSLYIKKAKKYVSVAKIKTPKHKSKMWGNT